MIRPIEPPVERILKEGVKQRVNYFRPSKKDFVKIAHKDTEHSPAARLMSIRQLTLKPFTVIPTHSDPGQELVLMPKHGHAEVMVWDVVNGEPQTFKLNMGEGPVVVPAARSCAIQTFATTVTLYIFAYPLSAASKRRKPRVLWQKGVKKLCKNKRLDR